jgi:hypothetical protein
MIQDAVFINGRYHVFKDRGEETPGFVPQIWIYKDVKDELEPRGVCGLKGENPDVQDSETIKEARFVLALMTRAIKILEAKKP